MPTESKKNEIDYTDAGLGENLESENRAQENLLFGEASPAFTIKSRGLSSYDIPEITNLNVTKKGGDKFTPSTRKNPLMAGFPNVSYEKWNYQFIF